MPELTVTSVGLTRANRSEARTGLLGWLTIVINDALLIDGIALRRTRDGRVILTYPKRTDAHGRRHFVLRPLGAARREIERQVLERLGLTQEAAP